MPTDAQLTDVQRRAAIGSVAENVALRSGAGCGKTFVLARRFVELLARQPADSDQQADAALARLVALTFTNKAALEMSSRVRAMLDERARAAEGDTRARMLAWLERMPDARISTIDGFCANLLRSHAVEAGVDPNFAVCADELLASRMIADAAERAVLAAAESERADVASLLADMGFDPVVGLVRELMDKRLSLDLEAVTDASARMNEWNEILTERRGEWLSPLGDPRLRAELDALAAIPCADPADKLAVIRQGQVAALRAILDDPRSATPAMFAGLSSKPGNVGSAKAWGDKETVMDVRRRIKALVETVADFAEFCQPLGPADRRAAEGLATLARLAAEADAIYTAAKRTRGMLDFRDLQDRASRLLAANPQLRAAVGSGIGQLLIDECQDTNRFQLELLAMLIGGGTPEQAPPPGRLFAVGDAKQSIYRFRDAQVEVFAGMCKRLGPQGQLHLDESFRTHKAGVAFVNDLLSRLMGDAFAPTAARREQCPPGPSVEIILAQRPAGDDGGAPPAIARAAEASEAQAHACAQRIREILDGGERIVWDREARHWRPARAGDIAILFARMTNSLAYERALQQRRVPYYVVAGMGFFQRQEVFDVLTALSAVDDPRDDIALAGFLRGGMIGLSDNALMHVAEACEPPYWPALLAGRQARADEPCLADRLSPDDAEALATAVDLVARLHAIKDAMPIDELLQRLLEATGFEAALLSQFEGRRMLSNVRQVLQRAASASADHMALADFIAEMRGLIADESRYEQAAVAGEHENVVRLMTIHKAKGLEFPVVIVPDLSAGRRGVTGRLLVRDDWGAVFNRPAAGEDDDEPDDDAPLSFRLARRFENEDQRAEDFRKLYVAVTRHEDHLILIGADWRNAAGEFMQSGSYMAAIDEALGVSAALEAGGESRGTDDRAGDSSVQGRDAPDTHGQDAHATCHGTIPYADGRYRATVRCLAAGPASGRSSRDSAGGKLLDAASSPGDLAERIIAAASGSGDLPLLGPLPPTSGLVEIAVTALNDFASCPMLYRWRHELRVPRCYESLTRGAAPGPRPTEPGALDAATVGTLYHKCMEVLDVAGRQDAAVLVDRAAEMLDIEPSPALDAAAEDFAPMLAAFRRHELCGALASARDIRRELDFVLECGSAVVRGQIDLLYQDGAGAWHVVDYKSDRVDEAAELAEHAGRYDLQLKLYAHASGLHLGEPVTGASLYFLRPAATVEIATDPASLGAAVDRTAGLAKELIAARRAGKFERRGSDQCHWCSYAGLCGG